MLFEIFTLQAEAGPWIVLRPHLEPAEIPGDPSPAPAQLSLPFTFIDGDRNDDD
jgi:hypothetical protein